MISHINQSHIIFVERLILIGQAFVSSVLFHIDQSHIRPVERYILIGQALVSAVLFHINQSHITLVEGLILIGQALVSSVVCPLVPALTRRLTLNSLATNMAPTYQPNNQLKMAPITNQPTKNKN